MQVKLFNRRKYKIVINITFTVLILVSILIHAVPSYFSLIVYVIFLFVLSPLLTWFFLSKTNFIEEPAFVSFSDMGVCINSLENQDQILFSVNWEEVRSYEVNQIGSKLAPNQCIIKFNLQNGEFVRFCISDPCINWLNFSIVNGSFLDELKNSIHRYNEKQKTEPEKIGFHKSFFATSVMKNITIGFFSILILGIIYQIILTKIYLVKIEAGNILFLLIVGTVFIFLSSFATRKRRIYKIMQKQRV